MNDSIYTIIPPIVAILVAIWRKSAIQALLVGLVLTYFMSSSFAPLTSISAMTTGVIDVATSTYNQRIIIFSLLIGAVLALVNASGGVTGFIHALNKKHWVDNDRKAAMVPTLIGSSIFTDTNLSMFTAGLASQSIFDKYKLSRARLAFILDSTCSPISILLLINGWGAYILGLLDGYNLSDEVGVLISTIGYNFYPIIVVCVVYYTALSGRVFGPLKDANSMVESKFEKSDTRGKASYLVVPMMGIIFITLGLLYYTGDGDLRRGSGSFSVLWAVVTSYLILILMLLKDKVFSSKELLTHSIKGIKNLVPAVMVLVLSFAFGDAVKAFGTGTYVSGLMSSEVSLLWIAPLLFITAGIMAFATGTSWGTFAILFPIALPIALQTGIEPAFLLAAVLGGGVFGDHASPISDSTIVASIASGCDHIEHVKTQLPYCMAIALVSLVLYVVVGSVII
ncbi:Na+/H+ antiporter NhaC family protein [Pseudoalteromonas piratica]|uniref:Sodium:proton antiporter n=1 Tax=Pseudoalteromonas piratica TaxID=1348114 RepID=A0A0A7EMV6_9GAMM|nr:Na+/H+ antiporter NhaC family protein [Pseudoalteromonas piratica]AIY67406.1 sodium:proton antiporter [Pseudoalteromonas piratica]